MSIAYEAEAEAESNEASRKYACAEKKKQGLKADIKKSVDDLYVYQNSTDGLPVQKTLSEWINKCNWSRKPQGQVAGNGQAQQGIPAAIFHLNSRCQYQKNWKGDLCIWTGLSEILHGLNLAKLKVQDNELASDLKAIPIRPTIPSHQFPTNVKCSHCAAALIWCYPGAGIYDWWWNILTTPLKTWNMHQKYRSAATGNDSEKCTWKPGIGKFRQIQKGWWRSLHKIIQGIEASGNNNTVKVVTIPQQHARKGKSVITANIIKELKEEGKNIAAWFFRKHGTGKIKPVSFFIQAYGL